MSDSAKKRYNMKEENKNGEIEIELDNLIQSKLRLPKKWLNELVPAHSNKIQNKNTEIDGIGVVNHMEDEGNDMNDDKTADDIHKVDDEQRNDGMILLIINSTKFWLLTNLSVRVCVLIILLIVCVAILSKTISDRLCMISLTLKLKLKLLYERTDFKK